MPVKSTYRHYNVSDSSKKTYTVDTFYGVDYTRTQLNTADNHAVEISNIIYKDKINQKRKGWQQIAQIIPLHYYVEEIKGVATEKTNTTEVNGVWTFIGGDRKKYIIAHIGKLLYKIEGFGEGKSFLDSKYSLITTTKSFNGKDYEMSLELENAKSEAFYGQNRLYILGGNKYYVLRVEDNKLSLNEVEDDEETYIPTTTVGITYKDSAVEMAAPLDDVNLMTQWRKNKLVSGTYVDDGVSLRTTQYWDFQLDSSVSCKKPTDINDISITIKTIKTGGDVNGN